MAAGSILIDLIMRTGSFETDTKRAEKRLREFKKEAEKVGAAVGVALAAAGTAAAYMAKQTIDGLDQLNDIADATGASIENISALEDVALRTGSSMDTVSAALIKFNDELKNADGKNGTSQALKAIGLDAEQLRRLDPAEALLKTAMAMAKFADDGDKARLVQVLFGKSTKEVAALLKDLADKGELVATVTTEQTKQAELFNQQMFNMQKNITDVGRSIMGDLLPSINAVLNATKEGGFWGWLSLSGSQSKNPGAAIEDVTKRLNELKRSAESFEKANPLAKWFSAEDQAARKAGIASLEAQLKALRSLQASQALADLVGGMDTSDAQSRRMRGGLPSVSPVPAKPPKGADPDADFKAYLKNLEDQIQKTQELTTVEKLLDDVRRKTLTVTDKQKDQLLTLAQIIDKEKEHTEELKLKREAAAAAGDAVTKANEEYQAFLQRMRDAGPGAQLEKQRKEMLDYAKALTDGHISEVEYLDAVTGRLGLTAEKLTETNDLADGLAAAFSAATKELVTGGADIEDVFKNILRAVADLILQITVLEPMAKSLREAFSGKGGGGGGGGDWLSGLMGIVSNIFGGFRADGGPVSSGKAYIVGERGPEMFVPRTAGAIVPNQGLSGGGGTVQFFSQNTFGDIASMQQVLAQLRASERRMMAGVRRAQTYGAEA